MRDRQMLEGGVVSEVPPLQKISSHWWLQNSCTEKKEEGEKKKKYNPICQLAKAGVDTKQKRFEGCASGLLLHWRTGKELMK